MGRAPRGQDHKEGRPDAPLGSGTVFSSLLHGACEGSGTGPRSSYGSSRCGWRCNLCSQGLSLCAPSPCTQAQNRPVALSKTSLPRGRLSLQTQLTGSDPGSVST